MNLLKLTVLMLTIIMNSQSQPIDSMPEEAKSRLKELLPGFGAYGFNLSGMSANANVLWASKSGILLRYSDEMYYLFATYDLELKSLSPEFLDNAYKKVKVIFIRHSLQNKDSSASSRNIPDWVKDFKSIECLILDNVDLHDESALRGLKIKFLGILNAKITNPDRLIQTISGIDGLEFLMYSSEFSSRDIDKLKRGLPRLTTFQPTL